MLPKKNRADKKTIDLIFKRGKSIASPSLIFKFTFTGKQNPAQISFIASKNIAKLATKRNFLRRCGYDALGKYITKFPAGLIGVFMFTKNISDTLALENEIKNILHKIN